MSFGGPIAHLGYFRDELVTRRKWLSDSAYADLVALCQFLPGPTSSQVGFALGMMRAGWLCALAAFMAFTLSSALVLLAFAMTATSLSVLVGTGALHGLKIVAVAIAAQAVLDSFYRAGALVFGGGHVVLPLLEAEVVQPGWITQDAFLAGYGAVQAVPGPLFTFAAYLGAALGPEPNGAAGAALALVAVFLPGFLILIGVLPFWDEFRTMPRAQSLMRGANAAVVGILSAALYSPVFTSAIGDMRDFALALACFLLLVAWKMPPWIVVIVAAVGGVGLTLTA